MTDDGFVACEECQGTGDVTYNYLHYTKSGPKLRHYTVGCPYCGATGQLDWIEYIINKGPKQAILSDDVYEDLFNSSEGR